MATHPLPPRPPRGPQPAANLKLFSPQPPPEPPAAEPAGEGWTLGQFFEAWYLPQILRADHEVQERSIEGYRQALAWWARLSGDPPLTRLDQAALDQFKHALRASKNPRGGQLLSATTVANVLARLRSLLWRAGPPAGGQRGAGLLTQPLYLQLPKRPKLLPKPVWSLAEAQQIMAQALATRPAPLDWAALCGTLFYTGLRLRAALGLAWKDYQPAASEGPRIELPATLSKTKTPERIAVHPLLARLLARLPRPSDEAEAIFAGAGERRWLYERFLRLQRAAAATPLGWHAWRRLYAQQLGEAGAAAYLAAAQQGLGHADVRTTSGSYAAPENVFRLRLPWLCQVAAEDDGQRRLFE